MSKNKNKRNLAFLLSFFVVLLSGVSTTLAHQSIFGYDVSETFLMQQPDTTIYSITEVPAVFPGGDFARINYLFQNLEYPEEALEQGVQGKVFVSFVVEVDGSISNVKILRGIGGGCDEEVVRLVSNMPNWLPGRVGDNPVRTIFRMPVSFALREIDEIVQELDYWEPAPLFDITTDAVLFVNGVKHEMNLLEFDKTHSIDDVETIEYYLEGKGREMFGYDNVISITLKSH